MSSFSSSFSTQSACSMTACKNGLGFLVLRLFLAYEFFEAGLSKTKR
ncbi:hypothetical protein HIPEINDE_02256 [Mannheimia haemolytica]